MKRTVSITFLTLLFAGFILSNPVNAAKIIWVSEEHLDDVGVNWDQGFVDMLVAAGYEVQVETGTMASSTSPLSAEQLAVLNSGDIVIVSRATSSGNYNTVSWNTVAKPMIVTTSYLSRANRWQWLNTSDLLGGGDSGAPPYHLEYAEHPIFAGVVPDENGNIAILDGTAGSGNTSLPACQDVGNGVLLATAADTGTVTIAYWGQGWKFHEGTEQVAAAPFMLFNCGAREATGGTNQGVYNLTPEGAQVFVNAVEFMLAQGPPLTTYEENFDAPVDLDFWRPNKLEHDDGTPVFAVTQESGAIKVVMNQLNFPDGQMYDFLTDNITFNLTNFPMWSMKIKVEPGATYTDGGTVSEIDALPLMGSPFSKEGAGQTRQHSNPTVNVPDDGEWHDVLFDWRAKDADQETNPNVYTNITRLLLETVKWPGTHQATFWIDDFKVGRAAVPPDQLPRPVVMADHPPAIDGELDAIWEQTPWNRDYVQPSGATIFRDAALSWRAMWDYDYLYLFIQSVDDIFDASTQTGWHGDGFELWLDGDNSKLTSFDGVNDLGYTFLYSNDPDDPMIFPPTDEWRLGTTGHLQGAAYWTYGSPEVKGGINLELAIPMENLGISAPAAGHLIGMDVDYNDRDGEGVDRDSKVKWFDATDNSWDNPSLMGTIELVDRVVKDYTDVWYTATPPVMDGEKDAMLADLPTYVANYYPLGVDSLTGYFGDAELEFQTAWDSNYVYYFINMQDDIFLNEGHWDWQDDAIELWLDGNNAKKSGYDGVDDTNPTFFVVPGATMPIDSVAIKNGIQWDVSAIQVASSWTDKGFYVEFGVPLDSVGIKPTNGWMFGHDVDYDDSDTEGKDRDTKVKSFAPVDAAWNQPVLWGTAMLMGGPGAPLPPEPVAIMFDKTAVAPVIDGKFDEVWYYARNFNIANVVPGGTVDDWWDTWGQFKVLYDSKNLYMLVQIHDDVLNTEHANDYDRDCVEIFFDGNNSKNALLASDDPWAWPPVRFDDDDTQLRFVLGSDGFSTIGNYTGFVTAYDTTETGWNLELAMPWTGNPFKGAAGLDIGFEIDIHDNDGADREATTKWWNTVNDESWHDPSVWGTAHFTDRTLNDKEYGAMLPIPFNEYPIEIDAEEDYAWADVPIVPINHRFNTYTNLSSDTDGRAEFKVMWDYDYIYYLMESWDDTLVDDSGTAWHNDDAFEIYIDADASRKTSYDGVNDWGFSFHYVEDGILEPVGSSGMGPALDSAAVASIKQAQKLTGTGIKLEVAIPMSLLGIDVGNNAFIAIDADWDDDDDGGDRDTKIKTYDNTDNSWQNPSLMGLAKLVGSKIESDVDVVADAAITTYSLSQNYPNPFNPTTTIEFTLPETQNVKLIVYDVLGREVARLVDGRLQAGAHNVTFKAAQHASGMYFYRLEAGDFVQTKKLMLLK